MIKSRATETLFRSFLTVESKSNWMNHHKFLSVDIQQEQSLPWQFRTKIRRQLHVVQLCFHQFLYFPNFCDEKKSAKKTRSLIIHKKGHRFTPHVSFFAARKSIEFNITKDVFLTASSCAFLYPLGVLEEYQLSNFT